MHKTVSTRSWFINLSTVGAPMHIDNALFPISIDDYGSVSLSWWERYWYDYGSVPLSWWDRYWYWCLYWYWFLQQ